MASMYEMIMDLPLFKGVGKDHVSSFLEKTHINFINYSDGDVIIERGAEVSMVKYVMTGKVKVVHRLGESGLTVEEINGHGRVFGADRLYGMSTDYPYQVTSIGTTSIMEFSKHQYVRLLATDNIYLINFFNYLSRRAQRPVDFIDDFPGGGIGFSLRMLVDILTDPNAESITINGDLSLLSAMSCQSVETVKAWIESTVRSGVMNYSDGKISILDRDSFVSYRP